MADVVAVEQETVSPHREQLLLDQIRDRGLARTRQTGEPQQLRLLILLLRVGRRCDVDRLPVDVVRAAQREMQHARADRRIRHAIDQDEAAEVVIVRIGRERQWTIQRDVADADRVQAERLAGQMLHRVHADLVLLAGDRCGHRGSTGLEPVRAARQHRVIVHPDDRRLELVRDLERIRGGRDHVAARAVDLVGERQRDRLTRDGLLEVSIERDDAGHGRGAAGGQDADRVAGTNPAARDETREAAEIEVRPIHPLHRHAERIAREARFVERHGFQMLEQGGAGVPRHRAALVGDVVTLQTRDRNRLKLRDAEGCGKVPILREDLVETGFAVVDEVHLVDREHEPADADQVRKIAVAASLRQHALARIDQDHGEVRGRGAGDHVARVLLVARGIGDDELATVGGEEAVRDVDRDALFAFGREPVHEQREIDLLALRADAFRICFERRQLIFEDHPAVIEQAPDQRGLAIVDAAAGDEAQQRLVLMLHEVGVDVRSDQIRGLVCARHGRALRRGVHQKYPSCFFFSIEAAWS